MGLKILSEMGLSYVLVKVAFHSDVPLLNISFSWLCLYLTSGFLCPLVIAVFHPPPQTVVDLLWFAIIKQQLFILFWFTLIWLLMNFHTIVLLSYSSFLLCVCPCRTVAFQSFIPLYKRSFSLLCPHLKQWRFICPWPCLTAAFQTIMPNQTVAFHFDVPPSKTSFSLWCAPIKQ